jgi:hypothetical protein
MPHFLQHFPAYIRRWTILNTLHTGELWLVFGHVMDTYHRFDSETLQCQTENLT